MADKLISLENHPKSPVRRQIRTTARSTAPVSRISLINQTRDQTTRLTRGRNKFLAERNMIKKEGPLFNVNEEGIEEDLEYLNFESDLNSTNKNSSPKKSSSPLKQSINESNDKKDSFGPDNMSYKTDKMQTSGLIEENQDKNSDKENDANDVIDRVEFETNRRPTTARSTAPVSRISLINQIRDQTTRLTRGRNKFLAERNMIKKEGPLFNVNEEGIEEDLEYLNFESDLNSTNKNSSPKKSSSPLKQSINESNDKKDSFGPDNMSYKTDKMQTSGLIEENQDKNSDKENDANDVIDRVEFETNRRPTTARSTAPVSRISLINQIRDQTTRLTRGRCKLLAEHNMIKKVGDVIDVNEEMIKKELEHLNKESDLNST